jgi:hypothetical protein
LVGYFLGPIFWTTWSICVNLIAGKNRTGRPDCRDLIAVYSLQGVLRGYVRPEHLLSLGVAEDIEAGHAGGGSGIILSLLFG